MRPIGTRSAWLTALLAGTMVLGIVSVLVTLQEMQLLERARGGGYVSMDEALASDNRVATVGLVYLIGFAVTAIVWCTWQHRAQKNLVVGGARGLSYTPGWAVGWWFVPVANLWMPFRTARELWRASDPAADDIAWQATRTWSVLWLWWLTWVASNIVAPNFFNLGDDATLDELIDADRFSIASDVLGVVAAVFAIMVVRSIAARQAAWPAYQAERGSGVPSVPQVAPELPPPPMPTP